MGISQVPETCRLKAYDYCNSTWQSVRIAASGELIIARGDTIETAGTVLAPNRSGGIVLGSGAVERVIITVPRVIESGNCAVACGSGNYFGIWIGGRSGTGEEPIPGSGTIISGVGMFVEPGEQKILHVRDISEIHVAGVGQSGVFPSISGIYGSGWFDGFPVTYLGEIIVC